MVILSGGLQFLNSSSLFMHLTFIHGFLLGKSPQNTCLYCQLSETRIGHNSVWNEWIVKWAALNTVISYYSDRKYVYFRLKTGICDRDTDWHSYAVRLEITWVTDWAHLKQKHSHNLTFGIFQVCEWHGVLSWESVLPFENAYWILFWIGRKGTFGKMNVLAKYFYQMQYNW